MIALGLILIVASLGLATAIVLTTMSQAPSITIIAGGITITASPLAMFIAGAVCVLVLWLGVRLTFAAGRRRRAQRKELKELRRTEQAAQEQAAHQQQAQNAPELSHAQASRPQPAPSGHAREWQRPSSPVTGPTNGPEREPAAPAQPERSGEPARTTQFAPPPPARRFERSDPDAGSGDHGGHSDRGDHYS